MPMNPELYSAFEEAFRGPRTEILVRLSGYGGVLAECSKPPRALALDLGCGRGEWLELLGRHGFEATGIDTNPRFVEQCQAQNLQAVCADAFAYLQSIPDHTVSLVSAFHLIEHLSHAQIGLLFSEALRVLLPEGLLLLETPSIDNLLVASKSFYCDPTHITPVHPEGLCFSLKQAGFAWATANYINGGVEAQSSHDQITRIFNGVAQDVCILASPIMPEVSFLEGERWQAQLHTAPTTLEAVYQYSQRSATTIQELTATIRELTTTAQYLTETIQQLELSVGINDARTTQVERVIDRVRLRLRPLLVVQRQLRRCSAEIRKPRLVLIKIVHATGLASSRNRALLAALLKRVGLYNAYLSVYQLVFSDSPKHQASGHILSARKACAARTQQIEADLARLADRQRGTGR